MSYTERLKELKEEVHKEKERLMELIEKKHGGKIIGDFGKFYREYDPGVGYVFDGIFVQCFIGDNGKNNMAVYGSREAINFDILTPIKQCKLIDQLKEMLEVN